MSRNDIIGGVCALLTIGVVAWLSLDSWARSNCTEAVNVSATDAATILACEDKFGIVPTEND